MSSKEMGSLVHRESLQEPEIPIPHETMPYYEWFSFYGIDGPQTYPGITSAGSLHRQVFQMARLRNEEFSEDFAFLKEIEASLPLEDCIQIEVPRMYGDYMEKKWVAPEGMAFRIDGDYHDFDIEQEKWELEQDGIVPKPHEPQPYTFIGKHLSIESIVFDKDYRRGTITVETEPIAKAVSIYNPGVSSFAGPQDEDWWYLPSRYDPEKNGAQFVFARGNEWMLYFDRKEEQGVYGQCRVTLVPYSEEHDDVLYVANFGPTRNDFKLDDFLFIDESLRLPPEYWWHKGRVLSNAIGTLVLPPMDLHEAGSDLWYDHGIMLKLNPTIKRPRHFYLDWHYGQLSVEWYMRRFNSGQDTGETFRRILVPRNYLGRVGLETVIKTAQSQDRLSPEEQDYVKRHFKTNS